MRENWEAAQLLCITTDMVLSTLLAVHTRDGLSLMIYVLPQASLAVESIALLDSSYPSFTQPPLLKDMQYAPCLVLKSNCTGPPVKIRWPKTKVGLLAF